MTSRILLDTSAITAAVSHKIDVNDQIRSIPGVAVVGDKVIEELKELADKGSNQGRAARLALQLLDVWQFEQVELPQEYSHVDDSIVAYAKEHRCGVLTQDTELKARLRKLGVTTYCIRERSRITAG